MDLDWIQKHRVKQQCADFIASIQTDQVCALASSYNSNRPCHIFAEPQTGSYNVCFFVEFDAQDGREEEESAPCQRWIARFPMPSVHDPVRKLKSEIATMKYVTQNTTIPIPSVHGYGFGGSDDSQNVTGLPFVLMDYIDGKKLCAVEIPKLPLETSQRFYRQLFDILTQLRRQEFPCIGALTLQDDQSDKPWILSDPPLTIDMNDQHVYNLCPKSVFTDRTFSTTVEYVYALYMLLSNRFYQQRNSVYDEEDAKDKIYALQQFKGMVFDWVKPEQNYGPFVLMHGDFRPSNVLIDDDHNILAIIDWEWSRTVPIQFFLPPTWFTGYDSNVVAKYTYNARYFLEFMKFRRAIKRPKGDPALEPLFHEWPLSISRDRGFFIANALHRFCDFEGIYWDGLHTDYLPIDTETVVNQYFKRPMTEPLLDVVKQKLEQLKEYQTELEASNLPTGKTTNPPESSMRGQLGGEEKASKLSTDLPNGAMRDQLSGEETSSKLPAAAQPEITGHRSEKEEMEQEHLKRQVPRPLRAQFSGWARRLFLCQSTPKVDQLA
ncbi:MAG: hypothetical protein M4579_004315 [Chaenotheca gracillima]|nr:MAG: hypothetical protein M4579_004315 [Chaenotheca gracillima]